MRLELLVGAPELCNATGVHFTDILSGVKRFLCGATLQIQRNFCAKSSAYAICIKIFAAGAYCMPKINIPVAC
jgi:hypothetical protein